MTLMPQWPVCVVFVFRCQELSHTPNLEDKEAGWSVGLMYSLEYAPYFTLSLY